MDVSEEQKEPAASRTPRIKLDSAVEDILDLNRSFLTK